MQTDHHPSRDDEKNCVSVFRDGDQPDTERCIRLLRDYIRRREQDNAIPSASRP